MEDKKRKALNEEELDKVTGGTETTGSTEATEEEEKRFKCMFCGERFSTREACAEHECFCPQGHSGEIWGGPTSGYEGLMVPIVF